MSRPQLAKAQSTDMLLGSTASFDSIEAALAKADQLSQQIAGSLTRLGGASTAIENAIKPISGSTQTYSNISKHVDATVHELEVLRSYQSVFEEEEPRIRRGSVEVPECLQLISRLDSAIEALSGSKLKSSQQVILKMNQLKIAAVASIRERFTKTLSAVSPAAAQTQGDGAPPPFNPTIADETLRKLAEMVEFFGQTEQAVAIPIYSEVRGKYINSHLTMLSAAAVRTDIKRVNGFYKKGSSPFHEFMKAMVNAIVSEDKNIRSVFKNSNDIQSTRSATLREIEKLLQSTTQAINTTVRKSLITDCLLAFDVVDSIHRASGDLLLAVDSAPFNLESTASKDLRKTAQDALLEMLRHTESQVAGLQQLPPDFKVLDITKQVTAWIIRVAEYDMALANIMIPLGSPSSWPVKLGYRSTFSTAPTGSSSKKSFMGTEVLVMFFSELIDDLLINIEIKARTQYKKVTRVGLQIISNLLFLEKGMRQSADLIGLLSAGGGFDRLDKIRKRGLNMFLEGWKVCASHLMDVTVVRTSSSASGSGTGGGGGSRNGAMSSRDREAVKEKFRNFNTDFEELVAKFKEYAFTDAELRAYLAKEVAFISPLYNRFYEKYKSGEFSKHTEKYIKYSKTQLDAVLAGLAN
ncbi:Cullin repeat-like-containing domain protein [Myxozyma melibiosi]|uniref:Exocyst complex protein EXO70 n=1 Tax=Myxozyma melibiosi TaxID=54550 RepID=A0ABR1F5Q2_9ASCO